jgi:hypothetical protein
MSKLLNIMFSLAKEQRFKAVSVPTRVTFSLMREKESTSKFQSYVTAAAKLGPELKKVSSLVTALDSQIQSYRMQLEQMKRKLQKVPGYSSDSPLSLASDVSSQPSKTSPQSLTPKQLQETRDKHRYDFKYIQNPKHLFSPITPRNGPSLERDVASKVRKSQNLSAEKAALKQEIVTLARSLEKIAVIKGSPAIKLNAIPHHVSAAASSEYFKRRRAVKARVRLVHIPNAI